MKKTLITLSAAVAAFLAFTLNAQVEYTDDCITFSSATSFTLKTSGGTKYWDGTLWTSTDKSNWIEWNGGTVSAAQHGGDGAYKLYVRGDTTNTKISGDTLPARWELLGSDGISCSGNIETLRGATGDAPSPTPMADYCYCGLFYDCLSLVSSPALPATTLSSYCYYYMFDCTSLTNAPALPATTLAEGCYCEMFHDCGTLTVPPVLPATTLELKCYYGMFGHCTSLTAAPALQATTLANSCYGYMFDGCTSLTAAPTLPATTLSSSCYSRMFNGCTSLARPPELPAMTLAFACYYHMFDGCTSLMDAPALPATTLANSCYNGMFCGCASLVVNTTAPGKEWKIPVSTTTAHTWGTDMFSGTGGTLGGQPALNMTYYIVTKYTDDCITFSSADLFTLKTHSSSKGWDGTMWTSTDKTTWTEWIGSSVSAAWCGSEYKLYVRGDSSNTVITMDSSYDRWVLDGTSNISCSGNIETLRGATGAAPSSTPMADGCYISMFACCTSLTDAPTLPATMLSKWCYSEMFLGCTSLTNAPALPATALAERCYAGMFRECVALAKAPVLSATTMAECCYISMFQGCIALTTAPALPATMLARSCYDYMFYECTSLKDVPVLPAKTLAECCYYAMFYGCQALEVNVVPPGKEWKISAEGGVEGWGSSMFTGTGGTLQGQPALDTTYYIASAPQPIEPGGKIVVPEGKAEEKAAEINGDPAVKAQYLKAPEGVETTADYLGCFDAVATSGSTVAFVLNEKGTNEVVEATEAVNTATLDTVFSEESTMTIDKPLVGFYYSFKQGGDVSVGDKSDLNKLGGRDTISFELTKGPLQYFYQTLVTPTALPAK